LNVQAAVFPFPSFAVKVTTNEADNTDPTDGLCDTEIELEQLSVVVA